MVSKVCWQLANKWILSLTTVCLNRWVCCVLGNVSLNVGESKCSSSGRRSLARRGPSVVFSTGRRLLFISVWNIFPIWWKLEHCKKQMFPFFHSVYFYSWKQISIFWESLALPVFVLVKTWIPRTLLMQVEPEWTKASLRFERERVQAYEHQVFPFSLAFFHFHPLIHQQRNENKKFLSVFFHFLLLLNAPLKKL